jgi:hypothetical protein
MTKTVGSEDDKEGLKCSQRFAWFFVTVPNPASAASGDA